MINKFPPGPITIINEGLLVYLDLDKNDAWRQWSRKHGLEEKKFPSFEEAETVFHNAGFIKEKEATQDYSRLTSFSQFLKATSPQALNQLRRPGRPRIHATWRLAPRP